MPREFANVHVAIWSDEDFLALPPPAQHLYFVAMTEPALSYAGVMDWRPGRIVRRAAAWNVEALGAAASVLEEQLYLVIDRDTEEALVRAFVRRDGLMKNPRMAVSMANAYAAIASPELRGVLVHELRRLKADQPDLRGWQAEKVRELLSRTAIDPATYPCRRGAVTPSVAPSVRGSSEGSVTPSGTGSGTANPRGSGRGSVYQPPTPAPAPAPYSSSIPNASRSGAGGADDELATDQPTLVDIDTPPPAAVTPGDVVAAWVEACTANGATPSTGQRGQVGRLAKELLAAGNDPHRVLDAARVAGAKGFATIDRELTARAGTGRPTAAAAQTPSSDDTPAYWRAENSVTAMRERGE